ncbi:XRE family transcriptional regulator [Streptococcus acidominimus]|uniref:DNA-binding protein n=1 Tax=Streptococcus acidominimus TaxID=1326 RepID=A0A1Q8EBC7_STRAI|nr:XRE family transcriptional regulator [Streptococcus acidominimus]OLF49080.1 DNA-binding protein [Streptococcus acidominimus]SUN06828.1 Phage transcriptional repressor [Streptococcus acidominimus]
MFSPVQLKKFRQQTPISQTAIAKQLGVTRAAYSAWETGKTKPNQKNLEQLSQLLGIHVEEFESEHSIVEKYLKLTPLHQQDLEEYADSLLEKQNKVIPLFPIQVRTNIALSAGLGEGFDDEFETETVYSDKEYNYDIATWIKGDSMEPFYHSGEVALIREGGFDYDGAIYAVAWNEEVYIKKVYLEEDGFRLVSINKAYPDKFAPAEDEPRIVGKIVGNFMPVEFNS